MRSLVMAQFGSTVDCLVLCDARVRVGLGYALEAAAVRLAEDIAESRGDGGIPARVRAVIPVLPQQRMLEIRAGRPTPSCAGRDARIKGGPAPPGSGKITLAPERSRGGWVSPARACAWRRGPDGVNTPSRNDLPPPGFEGHVQVNGRACRVTTFG